MVMPETARAYARAFEPRIVVIDGASQPPEPMAWDRSLAIAESDPEVKRVMDFLGSDLTWHHLYSALDGVFGDRRVGGGKKAVKLGWLSEDELRRFKQTAQSYEAIRTEARHGGNIPAPDDPMSLGEGEDLVRRVVAIWIELLS